MIDKNDITALSGQAKDANSDPKLKAFAKHILAECEKEGFTINEVSILHELFASEFRRQVNQMREETAFKFSEKI